MARILDLLDNMNTGKLIAGITSGVSAELFVNGISVGKQASNGSVLTWSAFSDGAANCSWPVNQSGVQCKGLIALTGGDASAAECKALACDKNAAVWQFSNTKGCWAGTPTFVPCLPPTDPAIHWVGSGRSAQTFNNATLIGRDTQGTIVAQHTIFAPTVTPSIALSMTLDVPSLATGTGTRVLLDGLDCALIKVSLVDTTNGALITTADRNLTFTVLSGPARVWGVGNGDPTSHVQPNSASVPTFAGLGRAVLIVNVDCVSANRDLERAIDVDGAAGLTTVLPDNAPCPTDDIILAVDSDGLTRVTISIPVSSDPVTDGVLAVARGSMTTGANQYLSTFVG